MNRQYRVAIANLGCRVNRYEADGVAQQFTGAGFEMVSFSEKADIYIVNSCAVTGEAARKSRQYLRRARKHNPDALVVGMGCLFALEGVSMDADLSVGSKGKTHLVRQVETLLHERENDITGKGNAGKRALSDDMRSGNAASESVTKASAASEILLLKQTAGNPVPRQAVVTRLPEGAPDGRQFSQYEEFGSVVAQSECRAFVKIQDGCNQFCSYCVIPLARGRVCSREPEAIMTEVRALAQAGFRELTLTGIHVCSYGSDFGRDSMALLDLCDEIARIDGIQRIRFGSVEPMSITPRFIERFANNPRLCPHLHLSLQSGSCDLLHLMRRRYNPEQYETIVRGLRTAMPGFTLTTDIIVGFPGETEEMHKESLAFCERCEFAHIHVFRYAERPMTAAAAMSNKVPGVVSERRSREFRALDAQLRKGIFAKMLGCRDEVLLEQEVDLNGDEAAQAAEKGLLSRDFDSFRIWRGYTKGYLPAYVCVRKNTAPLEREGAIVSVRLLAADDERLWAEAGMA